MDADYIAGERYIIFGYSDRSTGDWLTNECSSIGDTSKQRARIEREYARNGDSDKYNRAIAELFIGFQKIQRWLNKYTRS